MKFYELTCLIQPNLSEEELKLFQEKIKTFIQEEDGILIETKSPIKKSLSYSIKGASRTRQQTAYLFTSNFNLAPEKLENLEKKLKQESQILRYLILSKKVSKVIRKRPIISLTPVKKIEKVVDELRSSPPFANARAKVVDELRSSPPFANARAKKGKVKLKEIEEKLEEILDET